MVGYLFVHFDSFYARYRIPESLSAKINSHLKAQILDAKNYTLYDDAVSVLHACTNMGFKHYMLSNNFPELPLVVRGLGLSKYFVDYIVSAHIGYEKPRAEIFQHALEIANFPKICYMIGDNPVADVQGGKAAGMRTILVHRDVLFDAVHHCRTLSEVSALLSA